jgi:hypothetical protein
MILIARLLASFILGAISYFIAGIAIPRITGVGRFYSVPLGGYAVSDSALVTSALAWIVFWFAILYFLPGCRKGTEP